MNLQWQLVKLIGPSFTNNWACMEYHIIYAKEEYFYKALHEGLTAQGLRCDFRKSGLWVLAKL